MRTGNYRRRFLTCALAVAVFWGVFPALSQGAGPPEDIQKKRTALMKKINKTMRLIRVYAKKSQMKELTGAALDVAKLIDRIPGLSPEGSAFGPKSRIKPEVWEEFDRYIKLTEETSAAARSLAKVAQAGDGASLMPSFTSLAKACRACHKPFRKKKKRN
jgi:cytochrome c556